MKLRLQVLTSFRIENYCIPVAATASILRLFVRTFIEQRGNSDKSYGVSGSSGPQSKDPHSVELHGHSEGSSPIDQAGKNGVTVAVEELSDGAGPTGLLNGSQNNLVEHDGMAAKYVYEFCVNEVDEDADLPGRAL